ncbi:hypothetical protein D3C81_2190280 [compost metagenome]
MLRMAEQRDFGEKGIVELPLNRIRFIYENDIQQIIHSLINRSLIRIQHGGQLRLEDTGRCGDPDFRAY